MTAAEPAFIDTNVLIYASRERAPQHGSAVELLRRVAREGGPTWISRQVIREYLASVTRPQPSEPALTPEQAVADVRRLMRNFFVADESEAMTEHLVNLVRRFGVKGRQIHDANIVATMLVNGIHRLLTFNVADFRRFEPLIVLEPLP
jgi:predicted nucleic acid-binding protein